MILFAPPSTTGLRRQTGLELANRATLVENRRNTCQYRHTGFFVHPAEALHGDLGMIESRDVMLFISYSGGAKELDLIIPRLEDNLSRCWR